MGWSIGTAREPGLMRRSAGSIANLARHVADNLPARDWSKLKPVLDRHSGDPFAVAPKNAGKAADLLDRAAPGMPNDWASDARELAATARHAAHTRQNWTWR